MVSAEQPPFTLAAVHDNAGGWGPSDAVLGAKIFDIPYAPYSKSDHLNKVADWNAQADQFHRRRDNAFGADVASSFAFAMGEGDTEEGFSLVDRSLTAAPQRRAPGQFGRGGFQGGRGQSNFRGRGRSSFRGRGQGRGRGGRFGFNRYQERTVRVREFSIPIKPEWTKINEIEFSRLSKLFLKPSEPTTLVDAGELHYFDRSYDRIISRQERPLLVSDTEVYNSTASSDAILKDLAAKVDPKDPITHVFTTDSVLTYVMSAPKSVYSWDIVVTRDGNKIFMDKREGSSMDYYSVNENATEAPLENEKDPLNTPDQLAEEARSINNSFISMVSNQNETVSFKKNISSSKSVTPTSFRYRVWNLDNVKLYVRTRVDIAVNQASQTGVAGSDLKDVSSSAHNLSETQLVTLRALNEFEARAGLDWRTKLDSQKGAIIVTEIKNNGVKLTRWALEALLSGTDQLRLGFVGRLFPKDPTKHVIYGIETFRPSDFVAQINYNVGNGWGIAKVFIDLFAKLDNGRYLLVRDPNKPALHILGTPDIQI